DESRKFLDDACTKLLRTLGTFERLYTLRAAPLALVQISFVGGAAALLRAEGLHAGANKRRSHVIALAHQARDALRAMGAVWPAASPVRAPPAASQQHAHTHSVPAVVVQDANTSALVDPLFNPFGGDVWAYAPFGVPVPEDPMLGVHPGMLNPDAGAGAALFAPAGHELGYDVFMGHEGQEPSTLFLPPGPGQEQQDVFLQQDSQHDVFLQPHQQQHPWPWPPQQQQQQ
ncbi:hypothetical protein AURDEDRAFT_166284, partial [Auricularia subglabra TFB-10046 SS5]